MVINHCIDTVIVLLISLNRIQKTNFKISCSLFDYVNGHNTYLKVSSIGSGKTIYIKVDLACSIELI